MGGLQKTNDLEESDKQSYGGIVRNKKATGEWRSSRQVRFMLHEDGSSTMDSKVI